MSDTGIEIKEEDKEHFPSIKVVTGVVPLSDSEDKCMPQGLDDLLSIASCQEIKLSFHWVVLLPKFSNNTALPQTVMENGDIASQQ